MNQEYIDSHGSEVPIQNNYKKVYEFDLSARKLDEAEQQEVVLGDIYNSKADFHSIQDFALLHGEFVLIQKSSGLVRIVRDKMGIMPLYYFRSASALLVSTCFSSLLQKLQSLELNELYFAKIKSLDFSDRSSTIDRRIHRLPPAHYIEFTSNNSEMNCYWKIEVTSDVDTSIGDKKETGDTITKFRNALKISMSDRLAAHPKTCLYLSGGFDSCALFYFMHKFHNLNYHWRAVNLKLPTLNLLELKALEEIREIAANRILFVPYETEQTKITDMSNWPPHLLYSPGLAFFRPLVSYANKIHATCIWNGLGGDDIYSPYESSLADLSIRDFIKTFPKLKISARRALWSFLKYKLARLLKYRNGRFFHQNDMAKRLGESGAMQFAIETEQEFNSDFNLRASYPLLDTRLLQCYYNASPVEVLGDFELGKKVLRHATSGILSDTVRTQRQPQQYQETIFQVLRDIGEDAGNNMNYKDYFSLLCRRYQKQLEKLKIVRPIG